jgi:hypothetical protein
VSFDIFGLCCGPLFGRSILSVLPFSQMRIASGLTGGAVALTATQNFAAHSNSAILSLFFL